jgi:hypothetical protein
LSPPLGTWLGAVRCLDTLKLRCVVDEDTACWLLHNAKGQRYQYKPKTTVSVHVHGRGKMPARRIAWEYGRGEAPPAGRMVAYSCKSHDCCNPAHLRLVDGAGLGKLTKANGRMQTMAKRSAVQATSRSRARTKLTLELAHWIRESAQTQTEIGHAIGIGQGAVSDVITGKTWRESSVVSSVFSWRPT